MSDVAPWQLHKLSREELVFDALNTDSLHVQAVVKHHPIGDNISHSKLAKNAAKWNTKCKQTNQQHTGYDLLKTLDMLYMFMLETSWNNT